MKERMKRRLVGALVLSALAVIFLPELLQNPKDYTQSASVSAIPPRPVTVQPTPALLPTTNNEPLITPLPPRQEVAPIPAASTEPTVSSPPIPAKVVDNTAWVIQVASYTSQNKATRLQNDLRKKGFTAFIVSSQDDDQPVQLVEVGPELEQNKAESMAAEIKQKFHLQTTVVRYPQVKP